jgi:hypothetical protein
VLRAGFGPLRRFHAQEVCLYAAFVLEQSVVQVLNLDVQHHLTSYEDI